MPYIWHYCFCILLHNACKTHIHRVVYVVVWCLGYFYPSLARSFWTDLAGFRHKGCLRLIIHCRTRVSASSKHIRYVILDSCSKFQLSRFSRSWHVDRRTSVIKLLSCPHKFIIPNVHLCWQMPWRRASYGSPVTMIGKAQSILLRLVVDLLHNKSTRNRSKGVWAWKKTAVASNCRYIRQCFCCACRYR